MKKKRPLGTIPEMGERGEFNYGIYCKNFCKCHIIPPVQQ
jgi:hypothetical protein